MNVPESWIEHRRRGRELVGSTVPVGEEYEIERDGQAIPVRIAAASAHRIVCIRENHGSVDVPREEFVLPFPRRTLRPRHYPS